MLAHNRRAGTQLVEKIMREGRSVHSPSLVLKYIKVGDGAPGRISVVASKKVDGRAVRRNRARRRVYAVLSKHKDSIPAGIAGVILTKKEVLIVNHQNLEQDALAVLKKSASFN